MGAAPAAVCPRCGGRLSAPIATSPAPMSARGRVRWVATPPPNSPVTLSTGGRQPAAASPTPSYPVNPGWGLWQEAADVDADERPSVIERWAFRAPGLLLATAVLYAAACGAELIRFLLLVYNRTHLIPLWAGFVSDALVWLTSPAAIVLAAISAPAAVCRLIVDRAAVFDVVGRSDPRSARSLALGCLVPVVNWVYPGVFLTEIDRAGAIPAAHRFTSAVRGWWALWLLGWAMLLGQLALRRVDGLQAAADAVLFSAVTDLVAAAVAVATAVVFRRIRDEAIEGGPRRLRRWVISVEGDAMVDKATPGAIAPIRGVDAADPDAPAGSTSDPDVPAPAPSGVGTERI